MAVIRAATADDIPALVALGAEMYPLSVFATQVPYDAASVAETCAALLQHPDAGILVAADEGQVLGMLALLITPLYFNSAVRIASEIAWFMTATARRGRTAIRLLQAGERWAQECGAQGMVLSALAKHAEVGAFYEHWGYALHEASYVRCVWPH